MAYIGKTPIVGNFQKCDSLNASATADYTLQVGSTNVVPESVNHMIVSLNGVIQAPTTAYTVSGATLSFASALTSNDTIDFVILLGNVLDIGTPSDDTVTGAKIVDDAIDSEHYAAASIDNEHLADDAVGLAEMATGTDGNIISYDTSGNPVAVATGTDGQVLTSSGAGAVCAFEDAPSSGCGSSTVFMTGDTAVSGNGYLTSLQAIYYQSAAGTGIVDDVTSGHIRVDKTGWYLVIWQMSGQSTSGTQDWNPYIATWDGTNETNRAYGFAHGDNDDDDGFTCTIHALVDIDNVDNVKLHMKYNCAGAGGVTLYGTTQFCTAMTLIRLGDT